MSDPSQGPWKYAPRHHSAPWRGREGTPVIIICIGALLTLATLVSLPLLPRATGGSTASPPAQQDP